MSMARSYDEEFTAFAAAALPHLRRTAYLMSGDWHRAEDVAQDALIKVYGAWRRVEQREGLLPYARRTTIRLLIDESRRPWRRERPTAAAEALGCSEGTVKSQTSHALQTLRVLLGDEALAKGPLR